jgi:acetyl esterase/lipase
MQFGVDTRRDLTYASVDGGTLKLDLYLPRDTSGSCPVVLYLHGGAFMVGTRADFAEDRLVPVVRHGVAIASAHGPAVLGAVAEFFRARV